MQLVLNICLVPLKDGVGFRLLAHGNLLPAASHTVSNGKLLTALPSIGASETLNKQPATASYDEQEDRRPDNRRAALLLPVHTISCIH